MTTLVAIQDMMFMSKVDVTAAQLGVSVVRARRGASLVEEIRRTGATRVLLDLAAVGVDAVREVRADLALKDVILLGYCRHTAEALIAQAHAAGCSEVLTQGEFSARLARLLR